MIPCPRICPVCFSRDVTIHNIMPSNAVISALSRIGAWFTMCWHREGRRETVYIRCRTCGNISKISIL